MKKLGVLTIGFVAMVLLVSLAMAPVGPTIRYMPSFPHQWRIEPQLVVYTRYDGTKVSRTEFKLYCGTDETRALESRAFEMMPRVWIMHVPKGVRTSEDFREGYSVTMYFPGAGYSPHAPLHNVWEPEFSGSVLGGLPTRPGFWEGLPDPIKYVIVEFPEAVVIHYQPRLRTISVLFHPDYCEDYEFYRRRLFKLSPTI